MFVNLLKSVSKTGSKRLQLIPLRQHMWTSGYYIDSDAVTPIEFMIALKNMWSNVRCEETPTCFLLFLDQSPSEFRPHCVAGTTPYRLLYRLPGILFLLVECVATCAVRRQSFMELSSTH